MNTEKQFNFGENKETLGLDPTLFFSPRSQLMNPLDAESRGIIKVAMKELIPELNRVQALTLISGDTSFDVRNSDVMSITGSVAVTIATITSGYNGQVLVLLFNDSNVTITDDNSGADNTINLASSFISKAGAGLVLVRNSSSWVEVVRSVSGATPEWTYLASKSWTNSSADQDFGTLTTYDLYKLYFRVFWNTAGAFGLRLNNVSAANYSNRYIDNASVAESVGQTAFEFTEGMAINDVIVGECLIMGKHNNGIKGLTQNLSLPASGAGSRMYFGGKLTGDSNDVTGIRFFHFSGATTGKGDLYGMNFR